MFSSGSSDCDGAATGNDKRVAMFSTSDSDEAPELVAPRTMFSSSDEAPELVAPRTEQKRGHNEDTEPQSKVRKCEFQWASENHEQAARHLLYQSNLASFAVKG